MPSIICGRTKAEDDEGVVVDAAINDPPTTRIIFKLFCQTSQM